jgi:5-methylcytosine-specific restriction endonuclease McrA
MNRPKRKVVVRKPINAQMRDDAWLMEFHRQFGVYPKCAECKEVMLPGQRLHMDHRWELADGGKHAATELRPIHYTPCHKRKTRKSTKQRAHIDRLEAGGRKRHRRLGKSRGFQKAKRPLRKTRVDNTKYVERE